MIITWRNTPPPVLLALSPVKRINNVSIVEPFIVGAVIWRLLKLRKGFEASCQGRVACGTLKIFGVGHVICRQHRSK